jgi:arginine decarboxylase
VTDDPTLSPAALDITVRTGTGSARTLLAAFDSALLSAGVANFNLIPPGSRVRLVEDDTLRGAHGERLYCVLSVAYADHPGETAWAGLGWSFNEETGGLFVEHHGGSEESVVEQIELSLTEMAANRGGGYGEVHRVLASAHYVDRPVCALAVAAYQIAGWGDA